MKTILNSKGFLLFGIWVSTFAVCISSCKDDEEDIKYVDLRYNSEDSYVLAASSPQIVEFEVSSTFPWEILSKEDWHTITPSNGVADSIYKVKITCLENTSLDDRTDTLIIKSDYWIGKKVILIQKGTAWLKASSDSLFVESVEDQHVFSIASNQDWSCEVTTGSEWLSIIDGAKGSINGDVTIKTLGNKGELRYGIITLFDRHHLETILYDSFCQQGGICPHTDNILVIVIIRNAVHIHRIRQGLTLCRCGSCRKLGSLQSVVQSQYAQIDKRRQNTVDTVMEQIIQLALGQHG